MLFVFYHPPKFSTKHADDHKTKWQLLKELDYVGVFLFTGACLILLIACSWVNSNLDLSIALGLILFRGVAFIHGKVPGLLLRSLSPL
jgi:hypothetical protein